MPKPHFSRPSEALLPYHPADITHSAEQEQANVAATDRLLDVLEAELAKPDSNISDALELPPDEEWLMYNSDGSVAPPPLADIAHPDNNGHSYLIGFNAGSDRFARIVMIKRGQGGCTGRLAMDLRRGHPSFCNGWDLPPHDPGSLLNPPKRIAHQRLATPQMLDMLSAALPRAFDARQGRTPPNSDRSTAIRALGSLLRRPRKD